jgi:hypothetical protein
MYRAIKVVGVMLVLLNLIGCYQFTQIIKVRPDGSGTVEVTFLMRKEFLQMIRKMGEQMEGTGEGRPRFDLFSEAELKKKAIDMGEGVSLVSWRRIITDKFEGYNALYAYKDINKVRIASEETTDVSGKKKGEPFVFLFTRGDPSTLIIKLPFKPSADDEEIEVMPQKPPDPQLGKAIEEMFKEAKVVMAVEVQGSILSTNATHREGSKVTLVEMDFGKFFKDLKDMRFKQLDQLRPRTLEDAKRLMEELPGIKLELNEEVTIRFR